MRRSLLPRFLLSLFVLSSACVPFASAAVQNRITAQVTDASRVEISGSVHAKVKLANDLGAAPGSLKMPAMTLRFSMTADQQAALGQLLIDQQNPTSPRYHQWLTPAEYGAQFGLSSSDIAKVTAWLTSEGLTVSGVAQSNTFVTFDGTAAAVQAAFGTVIHNLKLNGVTHYANVTNPTVPSAFGSVVMGITGLYDFRLKPRIKASIAKATPQFTSSVSGNHYVAPGDFYVIYNETPLLTSATPINGSGITVAVMGQVDILTADVTAFRSAAGLTANLPTTVSEGGDPGQAYNCSPESNSNCPTPNLDDLAESSLDVEWSGAAAPAANILFVNGPDVFFNATTQAIDQNLAPIIAVSYGDCEAGWGTTYLNTLNQLMKQANAQGQTVVGPAGDSGATDCDASAPATQGLNVDFPASSPYVTGLGGTMFNEGSATYWAATDTTIGGSSSVVSSADVSALSYIPEQPWNDTSLGDFGGGGGGQSGFFTKPYWQVGSGVPADASRDVPDLSLAASDAHDSYLYCADGSCAVGFRAAAGGSLTAAGGTSFSTPSFAGMLALVEQKTGGRIGNANPTIYALANSSTYYTPGSTILNNSNVVFNDVTSGSNSMTCEAGSPNCPTGGTIGYSAASGYDLASGWGSVNAANLVNAWSKVTPIVASGPAGTAISAVALTATPATVVAGATVTFTANVTGSSGTPTGTVQFLVNNATVGSPVTLTSGVATYSYVTSCANVAEWMKPPSSTVVAKSDPPANPGVPWYGAGSGVAAAGLLLLFLPRRRRLGALLLFVLSAAVISGATGCSGSNNGTVSATTTGTTTNTSTTSFTVSASYSGDGTYAGSKGSGITAIGFTTTANDFVTPVLVQVSAGTCL